MTIQEALKQVEWPHWNAAKDKSGELLVPQFLARKKGDLSKGYVLLPDGREPSFWLKRVRYDHFNGCYDMLVGRKRIDVIELFDEWEIIPSSQLLHEPDLFATYKKCT